MMKPGKYDNFQMGLFDEWECSQTVKGTDVFGAGSGLVRQEWLSRCRKERALTQDLMSEIADLKNLETALRKVISNKGSAGIDGMDVAELKVVVFHTLSGTSTPVNDRHLSGYGS